MKISILICLRPREMEEMRPEREPLGFEEVHCNCHLRWLWPTMFYPYLSPALRRWIAIVIWDDSWQSTIFYHYLSPATIVFIIVMTKNIINIRIITTYHVHCSGEHPLWDDARHEASAWPGSRFSLALEDLSNHSAHSYNCAGGHRVSIFWWLLCKLDCPGLNLHLNDFDDPQEDNQHQGPLCWAQLSWAWG